MRLAGPSLRPSLRLVGSLALYAVHNDRPGPFPCHSAWADCLYPALLVFHLFFPVGLSIWMTRSPLLNCRTASTV